MIANIRCSIFCTIVLFLIFHGTASGQSDLDTTSAELTLSDALEVAGRERGIPIKKLDFPTRLQWIGLIFVEPERLDEIVGFFAYPTHEVCNNIDWFYDRPLFVKGSKPMPEAWVMDEEFIERITNGLGLDSDSDSDSDSDIVMASPLSDFCELELGELLDSSNSSVYFGFSEQLDEPLKERFAEPKIFWSTLHAAGLMDNSVLREVE